MDLAASASASPVDCHAAGNAFRLADCCALKTLLITVSTDISRSD
jgi:hypothetical protein